VLTAIPNSKSPYAAATLEDAYELWVERIFPMHKAAGRIGRKPTFKTWCKTHADKFEEFHTNYGAQTAANTRGKAKPDLFALLAEALAERLGVTSEDVTAEETAEPNEYQERREAPADCARNGVLWVLNAQGLLAEALERAEGDYITQDEGTALLTETFGPLSR
jgi:hypothetical protein